MKFKHYLAAMSWFGQKTIKKTRRIESVKAFMLLQLLVQKMLTKLRVIHFYTNLGGKSYVFGSLS